MLAAHPSADVAQQELMHEVAQTDNESSRDYLYVAIIAVTLVAASAAGGGSRYDPRGS